MQSIIIILTMMFSKPNQAVIQLQVSANPERITKKSNKHGPEKHEPRTFLVMLQSES